MSDIQLSADFSDIKEMNAELEQTLRSINPVANASLGFSRKVKVLEKNLESGVIDQKRFNHELLQMQKQASRAGVQLNSLGQVTGISNKSTRQMELQFQQAGYQIQDFIVQVQGGVNPLIAFSQQGSQLAGFFAGPWGAAIGLGIAGLSTLGLAFMASRGEAKDFEEVLSDLESVVNDYTTSAELAGLSTEELAEKFGYGSEAVRGYLEAFAELRKQVAIDELTEAAAALGDEFESLISVGGTRGGTLRVNIEKLREEFNLTREEALDIRSAIDQVGDSEGLDEVEASAHNLVDVLTSIYGSLGEIPPEFREMAFAAEAVTLQVLEIEGATASSTSAVEVLSGATSNLTGFASNAASAFGDLAVNAWESARALAATRLAQAESVGRGRGDGNLELEAFREGSTLGDPYGFLQQIEDLQYTAPTSRSSSRSSSGGSSGTSDAERQHLEYLRDAESILEDLKTDQERYNDQVAYAKELLEAGALTQSEYNEHLEVLAQNLKEVEFAEVISEVENFSASLVEAILNGDSLSDVIADTFNDIASSIISSQVNDLILEVVDSLNLMNSAASGSGGGGLLSSVVSSVLGGGFSSAASTGITIPSELTGLIDSFDGGGFTGAGARSGGLDNKGGFLAMLHPNETVIDHTRSVGAVGGTSSGPTLNVTIYENASEGETTTTFDPSTNSLTILMRQYSNAIESGATDAALNRRFGLSPVAKGV